MNKLPEHWTWRTGKPLTPYEAVIVDVDGVLADASGRQLYITRRKKDWVRFFANVDDDPLIRAHADLVRRLAENLQIVLLTARPYSSREATLKWLTRKGVRWDLLALRGKEDDHVRAVNWKRSSLQLMREFGFRFLFALEDDPRICAMYEEENLSCVYIHSGYYE